MCRSGVLVLLAVLSACAASPHDPSETRTRRFPSPAHLDDFLADFAAASGARVLCPPSFHRHVELPQHVNNMDGLVVCAKLFGLDWYDLHDGTELFDVDPVIERDVCVEGTLEDLLTDLAARGEVSVLLPDLPAGRVDGARRGERWHSAFERICSAHALHCARFGEVIAVSYDPIEGGAPLHDPSAPRASFDAIAERLKDGPVTIDAKGACFGAVVLDVGSQIGQKIRLDARVAEPVTLSVRRVPGVLLLRLLVRIGRVTSRLEGDTLVLSQRTEPPAHSMLSLERAPRRSAFELLARVTSRTLAIEGRLEGTVTGEVRDASTEDTIRALACVARCSLEAVGRITLKPREKKLEDLVEAGLQGTYLSGETRMAIYEGRVLEPGGTTAEGLMLDLVFERFIMFQPVGHRAMFSGFSR